MICPVCSHSNNNKFLTLDNYPIYQHPMDNVTSIPLPHNIDLQYLICGECAHAFQSGFDRDILENIYAYHYYTPSPAYIGATFRNEFIDFIKQKAPIEQKESNIFEVGCSSGDVSFTLKSLYPTCLYQAVEPNGETAVEAIKKGITVSTEFFTLAFVQKLNLQADVIFSRHVIEHIFDFNDFFYATREISHQGTLLILETPSLDWEIDNGSTMAFHVEHIHVFSERSLVTLAKKYGWYKVNSTVTPSGNLIVSFNQIDDKQKLPSAPKNQGGLQDKHQQLIAKTIDVCKNKTIIFWGAGSGAITLLASKKINPLHILDGNPNKKGKYFCGSNTPIEYAPEIIKKLIDKNEDIGVLMIISSSFHQEITETLSNLGWRGDIYAPYAVE